MYCGQLGNHTEMALDLYNLYLLVQSLYMQFNTYREIPNWLPHYSVLARIFSQSGGTSMFLIIFVNENVNKVQ